MDGGEVMHVGSEVAPWQIKDFSVALRRSITDAARRQNVTVAEWLHGHFTRYGLDGVAVAQTQQALPSQTGDPVALVQAAIALAAAAPEKMRDGMIRTAWKRVRHDLTATLPPPSQRLLANAPRTPESPRDSADESGAPT